MAVAPMRKVTVLGYRHVMDDAVAAMQASGVLQVVATPFDLPAEDVAPDDERLREIDERLAEARFVEEHLGRLHAAEHPFKTFVSEKFHLEHDAYLALDYDEEFEHLYRHTLSIVDRMAADERERTRLSCLIEELEPWRELRLEISRWNHTERTVLFTGTVPAGEAERIRARLRDAIVDVSVEQLGAVGDREAWVVIACRGAATEVRAFLANTLFSEVRFPDLVDYPAEELAAARARIAELDAQLAGLESELEQLSAERYHTAVALVQALESKRDRLLVRRDFARTERIFAVTGWTRADRATELEDALAPFGDTLDLTLEEPGEGDVPPVELDNPWFIRPFEILTDLYGRPSYRDLDPTPLIAPFFWLFFSICIGDVGYGAMLMIGAWLIKTRLDVAPGVKRFMDLLIFGGAGSMIIGVLLASYFAIPVESLPAPLRALQVLDPIADIQLFLLSTLVIGVVQVFFGVFVAAYAAVKRNDREAAVFDQMSIVLLFVMLGVTAVAGAAGNADLVRGSLVIGLVGAMIMQGRAVQMALRAGDDIASWDRLLGIVWVVGLIGGVLGYALTGAAVALWVALGVSALLVVSKTVRRGVLGVLAGAYNVYGLTGFVGDVLSYLRLAALGLSSALVGSVFNILTGLVWDAAAPLFAGGVTVVLGVVIAVLAVLVFAVGHVFNVVINLLGAFVHPARLQFVEFFSKFYEAGGRPFSPFSVRAENLVLGASGREREGGGS